MEGLENGFGELSTYNAETNTEKTTIQEWTEAELETDSDIGAFSDGESISNSFANGGVSDWLDKVSLEDLEEMDGIDDLYEKLSTIAGDASEMPDDNEGFQKVKRW